MNNNGKKVFIASPIFWGVDPYYFQSAMRLAYDIKQLSCNAMFRPQFGDSAVNRCRNSLTRQFLDTDCTHLLFIDSDLIFSAEHIERIMSHPEPIVGGIYLKKQQGTPQVVLNCLDDECPMRSDHMQRVKYVGTGFIRVAREVFEKMIERFGEEISYTCDHDQKLTEYDFWRMGVYRYKDNSKRFLTEDWYFCQKAIDLGYEIWVDMHIVLKHSGNALYPLKDQEKVLFGRFKNLEDFEVPKGCNDTLNEVFGGQYEFGIDLKEPRVIDIGANAGAFAWWSNWRWPGCSVTCYEPNTGLFGALSRNCSKIGAAAINSAVGDTDRTTLFIGNTPLVSSQYKHNRVSSETMTISVTDPTELPEADLVKIDVEGAERYIVEHMKVLPDHLIVEYHCAINREFLLQYLAGKMIVVGEKVEEPGYGVLAFRKLKRD